MPYQDLREFIEKLGKEGELISIEQEVDWNLEVGAITRRIAETGEPAPFFQKIKDYPQGYKILGGLLSNLRRIALALDLDKNSPYSKIVEAVIERRKASLKPNLLSYGPCKENIFLGDDVDLFRLPAPMIHDGDGGRYLCTWHLGITKDPETGWVNWGMYRMMVIDRNTMSGILVPMQHGGMHHAKYESMGKTMEFAVAIGTDPVSSFVSCYSLPSGINEVDIAGALRGE